MTWKIIQTAQVRDWYRGLSPGEQSDVRVAVRTLSHYGPALRRPLVGLIKTSRYHNMKELRPGGAAKHIRILFVFDPTRQAILLLGGNKAGKWKGWYRTAVPRADAFYAAYLEGEPTRDGGAWID